MDAGDNIFECVPQLGVLFFSPRKRRRPPLRAAVALRLGVGGDLWAICSKENRHTAMVGDSFRRFLARG